MDNPQFAEFVKHFCACYSDQAKWLTTEQSAAKTLSAWRMVLGKLDLDEARQAVTELLGAEVQPKALSHFPSAIKRLARQKKSETTTRFHFGPTLRKDQSGGYVDSFRCPVCRDWGIVQIWHPKAVVAMRDGRFGQSQTNYRAIARCSCVAGQQPCHAWLPEFNDRQYCQLADLRSEDVATLQAWCNQHSEASECANYTDFGSYGGN